MFLSFVQNNWLLIVVMLVVLDVFRVLRGPEDGWSEDQVST